MIFRNEKLNKQSLHWIQVILSFALLIIAPLIAQPAGYEYRKLITLNSSQISGSTAHANFPVMIKLTEADLRSTSNGGGVENPSGYDIIFTQSDGSTILTHELQNYTSSTGDLLFWVRMPSLSPATNSSIYLYFGKTGVYTDQSDTTTWNDKYLGVWHLEDLTDAAGNYILTDHNTATNSSGYLGAAREFDGDGDDLEDLNGANYLDGLSNLTVSLWAKANALNTDKGLIYADDPDGADARLMIRQDAAGERGGGANIYRTALLTGVNNKQRHESSDGSATTNWQYLTLTRTPGETANFYIDGSLDIASWGVSKTGSTNKSEKLLIGKGSKDGATSSWDGLIDEVRILNDTLSAAWIATEYANMSSPGTFHTVSTTNELPTLTDIETIALSYQANDPATLVTTSIICHDYSEFNLDSAKVQITGDYFSSEDTLTFASNYGISSIWLDGSGTLKLTGNASLADYSAALQEVYYLNNSSSTPIDSTRTVSFSVSDGVGFSNILTRDITIGATNNVPALASIEETTIAYIDGDPDTILTTTLAISDIDDYYLDTAWVSITSNYVSGEDKLDFTSTYGITPAWSSVTGELLLTGMASLVDYQTALRSITYVNLNPDPDEATRTISFMVSDGDDHSNTQTRNLSVMAVNSAPVLADTERAGMVYNAGDGAVAITDSITIYDGDDTKLDSVVVQITSNYFINEDSLGYSSIYGITGNWYRGIGKLVLSGNKNISTYETAVRTIIYENVLASPHTPTRVITWTAYDVSAAGSNTQTRSIAAGEPATIPNLDLWLNSGQGVYSDAAGTVEAINGDKVEVWKDQSGNGRDFIAGVKNPIWRGSVATLNGESSLEWSLANTTMNDADGESYINGLTEFTSFFVVKSDLTSTDKGFWIVESGGRGDRKFSIRYDAVGDNSGELNVIKVAILDDVVANEMESSAEQQSTSSQIVCLDWKSGEVWNLYVDGVLNSASHTGIPPSGSISGSDRIILGEGPTDNWDGMIAEVVHYGRHLTDDERISIEHYFSDKYAISVHLLEPATGGEAISADDANTTWTTLSGPRITEDFAGEMILGGTGVLNAPSGYEWDTGGTDPLVTVQEAYGVSTTLAASFTSRTSSDITFTIDAVSTGASQPGELTISGLRIRPTSGTVPNTGNITNTGTTGPSTSTSYGTMTMIAGTPAAVVYTHAPTNGTVNEILAPEILAEIQDISGNTIEISGTPINITKTLGSGTLTGTTSLNTDAYGQVTYSDLVINAADDYMLTASSTGLNSAVSDTFSVSVAGQYTTFLLEKVSGGNILTQTAGVDFTIKISAVDGTAAADTNFFSTATITSTGTLSNGGGVTLTFNRGVLALDTLAISSIGNYTITATDTSGNIFGNSNTFSVESGPASEVMSEITASPTVLENDAVSTSTITVQVKDAGGNNHSSGGETVNLLTTAGTLLGSVVDHGNGTYTQSLQSSSTVELATITCVLNGNNITDDATVQFNAYTNIWESDPGSDPYTTKWDTLLNWDAGTVPDNTDALLIPVEPADGTRYPIISTDNLQVSSLTIETGADVTLTGGISFDIFGDLLGGGDINGSVSDTLRVGGDMGIASSNIKYVEFNGSSKQYITSPLTFSNVTIDNTSNVEVADDVEVTGTLTLTSGSLIIASGKSLLANTKSITSGTIQAQREIIGSTGWRMLASPVASTYDDLFSNIFTQGYTGSDSAGGSPSILWYDETYAGTDNQRWRQPADSSIATVAGRGLFVYVFGSIPGETAYSSPLPVILDVTGTEAEGTGGEFDFNVTYTADADTGWNLVGNPFCATIDWDNGDWTKTNIDNVVYVCDNTANSGAGAYLTWNGTSGSLGSGLIPPFQGFWVKANTTDPVLKIPKTAKTTGGAFYKRAGTTPLITLLLESDTLGTTTHIQFNENGSINKDLYDAYYLVPPTQTYLEFYSESYDEKFLSIQNEPHRFGLPLKIPLYVGGYTNGEALSGTFRLSWPRIDALHAEWKVTIEDQHTGIEVDLLTDSYLEFEHDGSLRKSLPSNIPSKDLTRSKPFKLLKTNSGESPRFIIKIDPGNAFPEIPRDYALKQNYPNPFNGGTTIQFSLPLEDHVRLVIYDIRGREVETLIDNEYFGAGHFNFNWSPQGKSSGIYFYRLQIGHKIFTKKMILLR